MKQPKPQRSEFMYQMMLLFDAMRLHEFKHFPKGLIKKLDNQEISSVLYYLNYIQEERIR